MKELLIGYQFALTAVLAASISSCCGRVSTIRPEVHYLGSPEKNAHLFVLTNARNFRERFGFQEPLNLTLLQSRQSLQIVKPETLPGPSELSENFFGKGDWGYLVDPATVYRVKKGESHPSYWYGSLDGEEQGRILIESYLGSEGLDKAFVGLLRTEATVNDRTHHDGSKVICFVMSSGYYLRHFWCESRGYYVSDAALVDDWPWDVFTFDEY